MGNNSKRAVEASNGRKASITTVVRRILTGGTLVALASLGVAGTVPPGALSDWTTTLGATLVSAALAVAIGIRLFHYQAMIQDRWERDRLQALLATEVQLNLEILNERPASMLHARTGQALGTAVLVQLPTTALENLINSGLEHSEVTFGLKRLSVFVQVHNSDVAALLSARGGSTPTSTSIRLLVVEVNQRQAWLKDRFEELLISIQEALQEEGIDLPTPIGTRHNPE